MTAITDLMKYVTVGFVEDNSSRRNSFGGKDRERERERDDDDVAGNLDLNGK